MDRASRRSNLTTALWGLVLLAAMASPGRAASSTFGICLFPATLGTGGTSSAEYATVSFGGCSSGFSSSLQTGAILNPSSLAAGLTNGTLSLTQPMPFGGTAVATATASLDQGVLRLYADSQGGVGGCGGSCTTTGGQAFPTALLVDTSHFSITDFASSAVGTFHAHLDGSIGLQSNASPNYSVNETWGFGPAGAIGCWSSATGLGFGPCLAGNGGNWLTSSFSNQSATGYDFTGTFTITDGMSGLFYATMQMNCQGGALCDFSNTASFSLTLPSDVQLTSDSGVLFTQPQSSAPEPGTIVVVGTALTIVGLLRRRKHSVKPARRLQ